MLPRSINLLLMAVAAVSMTGCKRPNSADEYIVLNTSPQPLPDGLPAEATVIVETIEVEGGLFNDWLLENALSPRNANPLRLAVQKWIRKGNARIIETVSVRNQSNTKSTNRSAQEIVYPTEYGYPSIRKSDQPKPDPDNPDKKITPVDAAEIISRVAPTPRKFETEEVGTILEVETMIDPATGVIDLTLSPDWIASWKTLPWTTTNGEDEETFHSPVFDRTAITTSITLQSGVYGFLGSGALPESEQSDSIREGILLVFVRADTDVIPPPSEPGPKQG